MALPRELVASLEYFRSKRRILFYRQGSEELILWYFQDLN